MKSANTDLVQIRAVAETALADLQPQFMTPELCKWALVKAAEGYSALEIRQTALEAQQIAIQQQLAAMSQAINSQNQLMMHMAKNQELQTQQVQQQLQQMQHTQAELVAKMVRNDTDYEKLLKIASEPKTVEYITNTCTVHVEGDVKGVINVEASNGKYQGGGGRFFIGLILALLLFSMLAQRRIAWYSDGSFTLEDPNCVRIEKSGKDLMCREK